MLETVLVKFSIDSGKGKILYMSRDNPANVNIPPKDFILEELDFFNKAAKPKIAKSIACRLTTSKSKYVNFPTNW